MIVMNNKNYFNVVVLNEPIGNIVVPATSNIITEKELIKLLESYTRDIIMIKMVNEDKVNLVYTGNSNIQYLSYSNGPVAVNRYTIQDILDELASGYTMNNLLPV